MVAIWRWASVGLAQTVRGRLRELALRLALGARTSELGLVAVSCTLPFALLGVAVGIGGGMALGRQLRAQLFEVGPADPLSLLAGCLVVAATVALTAALAVRRVSELEPANVLRREWDS